MIFSRLENNKIQQKWLETQLLFWNQNQAIHEMLPFGARQRKNISVEDQRRDIQLNHDIKIISWLKDLEE